MRKGQEHQIEIGELAGVELIVGAAGVGDEVRVDRRDVLPGELARRDDHGLEAGVSGQQTQQLGPRVPGRADHPNPEGHVRALYTTE